MDGLKTLMHKKPAIGVVSVIMMLASALSLSAFIHARSATPADATARCLYKASQSYYIHDDSWKSLAECQGLEQWQLLSVKMSLENMRSN